ncbi:hypothetical protein ASQ50_07090 [Marinobacter sp. LQ44]|nr:hypothetical protein ASQ50_07090 [Marinobacter sp. LQ44]
MLSGFSFRLYPRPATLENTRAAVWPLAGSPVQLAAIDDIYGGPNHRAGGGWALAFSGLAYQLLMLFQRSKHKANHA